MLGKSRSGNLQCTKEELEDHLHSVHDDPRRQDDLGDFDRIWPNPPPTHEFNMGDLMKKEVDEVVKRGRAGSAPGPSGNIYRVYKNCPLLRRWLWKLMRVLWRKGVFPAEWGLAEGCYVPKEEKSDGISQFRPISLLSVEVKIFMAVLSRRLTTYMLDNKFIDVSSQKGGIPGFSGCLEHNAVLTQLLHDAKSEKKDLAVVWMDMANAYGSVPHALIFKALKQYHVPPKVIEMVKTYFDSIRMRFSVNNFTTGWKELQKGILTRCTVSIILFITAMNVIIKRAQLECRGPLLRGVRHPSCRAFVDDITITTESAVGTRWIVDSLAKLANWARMQFKPEKSRSLVIRKGSAQEQQSYVMAGNRVPSLIEKPVKCLGKWYDSSMKDVSNVRSTQKQLKTWLDKIDRSNLPGRFKLWCYQFGLLPRLMWPILVYEVTSSAVESMERVASGYLRRWLGVPPCFSRIGLYGNLTKLVLPVSSIVEEFKATKVRAAMTLQYSSDETIKKTDLQMKTGRKWTTTGAIADAESRLQHKELVGTVCSEEAVRSQRQREKRPRAAGSKESRGG